jgi:hypothetical protein
MNIGLNYGFLVCFRDEAVCSDGAYVSPGTTDSKFIKGKLKDIPATGREGP